MRCPHVREFLRVNECLCRASLRPSTDLELSRSGLSDFKLVIWVIRIILNIDITVAISDDGFPKSQRSLQVQVEWLLPSPWQRGVVHIEPPRPCSSLVFETTYWMPHPTSLISPPVISGSYPKSKPAYVENTTRIEKMWWRQWMKSKKKDDFWDCFEKSSSRYLWI